MHLTSRFPIRIVKRHTCVSLGHRTGYLQYPKGLENPSKTHSRTGSAFNLRVECPALNMSLPLVTKALPPERYNSLAIGLCHGRHKRTCPITQCDRVDVKTAHQIALLLDPRSLCKLALTSCDNYRLSWTADFRLCYCTQHQLATCTQCSELFPTKWHQRVHRGGSHEHKLTTDRTQRYLRILDDLFRQHGMKAFQDDEELIQVSSEELDEIPEWQQLSHDFQLMFSWWADDDWRQGQAFLKATEYIEICISHIGPKWAYEAVGLQDLPYSIRWDLMSFWIQPR